MTGKLNYIIRWANSMAEDPDPGFWRLRPQVLCGLSRDTRLDLLACVHHVVTKDVQREDLSVRLLLLAMAWAIANDKTFVQEIARD